jgi:hypothetical protein
MILITLNNKFFSGTATGLKQKRDNVKRASIWGSMPHMGIVPQQEWRDEGEV